MKAPRLNLAMELWGRHRDPDKLTEPLERWLSG